MNRDQLDMILGDVQREAHKIYGELGRKGLTIGGDSYGGHAIIKLATRNVVDDWFAKDKRDPDEIILEIEKNLK